MLLNVVAPAVSDIEVAAANRAKRVRISCSRFRNAFKFPDIIRFVFLLIFRPFDLTVSFFDRDGRLLFAIFLKATESEVALVTVTGG